MPSIIELQLAKEAELREIEDAAILEIEESASRIAQLKISNRSEHQREMRKQQKRRARARKKLFLLQHNKFLKTQEYKPEREYKSVLIMKPIEIVEKHKRILSACETEILEKLEALDKQESVWRKTMYPNMD